MAKHMGIDIPDHGEVADALERVSHALANAVRGAHPDRNCWGDMLLVAQRDFDNDTVARAVRALSSAGWAIFIAETWCPWRGEIAKVFSNAKATLEFDAQLSWWQRVKRDAARMKSGADPEWKARTLRAWRRERKAWMAERGLGHWSDDNFVNEIVGWLRGE